MKPRQREWEEKVKREIKYLLYEYKDSDDDSRIVNVLEAIDETLSQELQNQKEDLRDKLENAMDTYADTNIPEGLEVAIDIITTSLKR